MGQKLSSRFKTILLSVYAKELFKRLPKLLKASTKTALDLVSRAVNRFSKSTTILDRKAVKGLFKSIAECYPTAIITAEST